VIVREEGGPLCFSATASFVAGGVLTGIGTLTVSRVRAVRELPYALIPILFAAQQIVEGGLWLTFSERASHLNTSLTHIYQFFSHVVWPIYIPVAIRFLETVPWRRAALLAFAAGGSAVGLYLLYFLIADPTTARVIGGHIDYISPHFFVRPVLALYILATCASSLFSSHPAVRWFGVATSASLAVAAALYRMWFISVWCFFAAVISVVVMAYFRRSKAPRRKTTAVA
jgi:hypothetical protein